MPQDQTAPAALREFAIIVDAADNVAVVKTAVAAGQQLRLTDGRVVTVTGQVTPGHRFATRAISRGDFVRQYGQPIGTSRGIGEGDPITVANMSNDVPVVRDLPADLHTAAPALTGPAGRPARTGCWTSGPARPMARWTGRSPCRRSPPTACACWPSAPPATART